MAKATLQDVAGINATQDIDEIIIKKSDLVSISFTPAAANGGEQILAALIAKAETFLTPTRYELDVTQTCTIESQGSDTLVTRGEDTYRRKSKTIDFDKLDNNNVFDPDDY